VNRLNSLLARYQEAYPNFVIEEHGLNKEEATSSSPWLIDNKELPPLLREYDATIYSLQEQLASFQNELMSIRGRSDALIQENESLRRELRETVQTRLSSRPSVGAGDVGGEGDVVENLTQQVEIAVQEKEACQEKWREAAQEVDRLEAELEMEKESHQWRVVEQQAHQVKDEYQQSVAALNNELEMLQNELRDTRAENSSLSQKVNSLKLNVNDLQQQLVWKSQETADTIFKEGVSDSKIVELKTIMDELRDRLSQVTRDGDELRRENNSLHTRVTEIQRRLSDTELRESDAVGQVREAVQLVEASVMEKDQAEMLVHQKEEELEEMKAMLAKVINKAGVRTREEVDNVKSQCNTKISQLTEEVHALEMENAEKQSRLDRLLREKRAVESELQQIYADGKNEGSKSKDAYEQLNKRAITAERKRDEANVKIDHMTMEIDRLKMEISNMTLQRETEVKQLTERLVSVQTEFETLSEDRETAMTTINQLNKKLQEATKEKEAAYRKCVKEVALIEQDQKVKTRDLEIRLQTTEDTRQQTVAELRRLLTAQQRMSARWKEECQTITHKFEGKLTDSRAEMSHLKKRNEELTSLLKDSQAKTSEVERMLTEYTRNIRRMEERVREAETQAGDAANQVARQSMRERQREMEREGLMAELQRSQRANETMKRAQSSSLRMDHGLEDSNRGELTLEHLTSSGRARSSGALLDSR